MTPTRQQTEQTLDGLINDDGTWNDGAVRNLREAAEAWLRLAPVACPNCKGVDPALCRVCGGSGQVPNPDLIEQMAETIAMTLHQHGGYEDKPQTEHWQDCGRADAHRGASLDVAVAVYWTLVERTDK